MRACTAVLEVSHAKQFVLHLQIKRSKKISPPRGEKRLNCCDTAVAQYLPRWQQQCSVKRSFHIVVRISNHMP